MSLLPCTSMQRWTLFGCLPDQEAGNAVDIPPNASLPTRVLARFNAWFRDTVDPFLERTNPVKLGADAVGKVTQTIVAPFAGSIILLALAGILALALVNRVTR